MVTTTPTAVMPRSTVTDESVFWKLVMILSTDVAVFIGIGIVEGRLVAFRKCGSAQVGKHDKLLGREGIVERDPGRRGAINHFKEEPAADGAAGGDRRIGEVGTRGRVILGTAAEAGVGDEPCSSTRVMA